MGCASTICEVGISTRGLAGVYVDPPPGFQTAFDRINAFRSAGRHRLRPAGFARGRSSSTQVLTGCGRGCRGFACTFSGLARRVGSASLYLFFASFVESVSASAHENILLPLLAQSVPLRQISKHLGHLLFG